MPVRVDNWDRTFGQTTSPLSALHGLPFKFISRPSAIFKLYSEAGLKGQWAFHQLQLHELDEFQLWEEGDNSRWFFKAWGVMVSFDILTLLTALAQSASSSTRGLSIVLQCMISRLAIVRSQENELPASPSKARVIHYPAWFPLKMYFEHTSNYKP